MLDRFLVEDNAADTLISTLGSLNQQEKSLINKLKKAQFSGDSSEVEKLRYHIKQTSKGRLRTQAKLESFF